MDHDAAGAAREEAARQSVWIAAMLIAIPLLAYAERKLTHPDVIREWKMRSAKAVERFAATSAGEWWKVAERARLLYEDGCA